MSWTKESIQAAINQVNQRSETDSQFRELCRSDFREAIRQVSGIEIPASFKINVIDMAGYDLNVILPPPKIQQDELTESELESVAGGSKQGAEDFFSGVEDMFSAVATDPSNPGEFSGSTEHQVGQGFGLVFGAAAFTYSNQ